MTGPARQDNHDVYACKVCAYELRILVAGDVPHPGDPGPVTGEGVLGAMEEHRGDIVTDEDWIFKNSMLAFGAINGVPVARVTAQPNPETGAYECRYLIIAPSLIERALEENVLELWFEMEDASLRIPLAAFTGDAARVIVEGYGVDPDEAVFVMMIAPDPDGRALKDGKAYTVGLFVIAGGELIEITQLVDGSLRLVHTGEIDVLNELGGAMSLCPKDNSPME